MKLLKFSLIVFLFALGFYLLIVGQSLLMPLVIALVFWFLINLLAEGFDRIRIQGMHLPLLLRYALSIATFVLVFWGLIVLISNNIEDVANVAPSYQANLDARLNSVVARFGYEKLPVYEEILEIINIREMINVAVRALSWLPGLAANSGIIMLYVVFLLLEQGSLNKKIDALFKDEAKEKRIRKLLARIKSDISKYFGIKMCMSSLTGLLSYGFLKFVGVDFAEFWAILIFLLNFIPTIGSIIATIFPSLITLVQFDTFTPFFVVIIGVTSIQILVGNLIEPRLMGKSLNLSPLVILINLSLWGLIWGIPGMFLCVPFLVISMIVFSHIPQTQGIAVILSRDGQITTDVD